MLPLVCNDAVAIFFMFDLTRKTTLMSVKEWYRQARSLNKVYEKMTYSFTLSYDVSYMIFSTELSCIPSWYEIRYFHHTSFR